MFFSKQNKYILTHLPLYILILLWNPIYQPLKQVQGFSCSTNKVKHTFITTSSTSLCQSSNSNSNSNSNDQDENVPLGSQEYYKGFVSRSMKEEPIERVSGDALLNPILKFTGSASIVIALFLALFLLSNADDFM